MLVGASAGLKQWLPEYMHYRNEKLRLSYKLAINPPSGRKATATDFTS
jgi:hypothetical protein